MRPSGWRSPLRCSFYAYTLRGRWGLAHANSVALHWTLGSAVFSALGAGILGFAHTWPQVNQWTHGTHVTTMHGHMAFFGAYAMIVLAMISYSLPALTGSDERERQTSLGRSEEHTSELQSLRHLVCR